MKCDELKPLVFSINDLAYIDEVFVKKNFDNPHDHAVYKATEVDAAIAELKGRLASTEDDRDYFKNIRNERHEEEVVELKAENERLKCELDLWRDGNIIREETLNEINATRRALFLARTEWARSAALSYHLLEDHPDKDAAATYRRKAAKWEKVQMACAKYAEKIKGAK